MTDASTAARRRPRRIGAVVERVRLGPGAAGVLVALVVLAVGAERYVRTVDRLYPHDVIDDAYITYRYAENWAAGRGPTWNRGEAPVEGYSAPLWMAVLAAGNALGADVPTLSKRLCLVSGAALLVVLGVVVWRARAGPAWTLLAVGALAAMPDLAVWSVGGMETAFYALLLLLSAWTTLEAAREPSRRRWWIATAVLLTLVSVSRGEGPIAVPAFLAALWIGADDPVTRRRAICTAIVPTVVVATHFLARRLYYGAWLPLPAHAKADPFVGQPLFDEFFAEHWPYLALAALGVLLVREGWRQRGLRYALGATALLGLVVLNVQPWMSAHGRYLFPAVPLLLLAAAVGASAAFDRVREPVAAVLLLAVVLVLQGENLLGGSRAHATHTVERYSRQLASSHVALGIWLRDNVDDDALLAVADCGVIPYYSGLRVIDLYGLNDAHIAEHGLDPDYVLSRRPELIVLSTQSLHRPLRDDERFREEYEQMGEWDGVYRLTLHCRRDYCADGAGDAAALSMRRPDPVFLRH